MPNNTDELAAAYAALILHDGNAPVSAENITALCKAANIKISPVWPKLYQQVFSSRKVGDFLVSGVAAGGAAPAPAAAKGAAPAAAKEEAKPKEEEKKEESDEDMGFGLFD